MNAENITYLLIVNTITAHYVFAFNFQFSLNVAIALTMEVHFVRSFALTQIIQCDLT